MQQVTSQQNRGGLDEYNPFSQENKTTAQPVRSLLTYPHVYKECSKLKILMFVFFFMVQIRDILFHTNLTDYTKVKPSSQQTLRSV